MVVLSKSLIIRRTYMDNNTINTLSKEYIHPLDSKVIQKMIYHAQLVKYVKMLDELTFTNVFIYAQLNDLNSLQRISDTINRNKTVQRLVGIESISKSQLSRKNGDIPPEIFQIILHHLIQKLHQVLGPKKAEKALRK